MRLQHLHLPGLTRYAAASALQDLLVRAQIAYHHPRQASSPLALLLSRAPLLVTFTSEPTYASGRRDAALSAEHIRTLTRSASGRPDAAYVRTPRGGLLTFHGPGQLTAYPLVHLRSHGLGARSYVALLEAACVEALARVGLAGARTRPEYPGVWVDEARKVVSVGVHVRRGVTCFGAGVNVATDPRWWERITACGIEGVQMVSVRDVTGREPGVREVGGALAESLAEGLRLQGVGEVGAAEAAELMQMAERAERAEME